ncbi:hypothetical protein ACHAW5_008774 [Stephanodiscus triporus]|uniref:ACB domain-containing protein n=1 Tax=Stephanodiscus triporus TaxID=2934178 RepID=A0ABD3N2R4_9STRA
MSTTAAATFRAKTNSMKSWRPRNPPSNRDRLELYALHKQAVSGDAPPTTNDDELSSVADRAKVAAWRTKRGMDQADAMARYVEECDRQLSVYGTRDSDGNSSGGASTSSPNGSAMHSYSSPAAATTAAPSMKGGETSASGNGSDNDGGNPNNTSYKSNANTTPLNAPASYEEINNDDSGDGDGGGAGGVLLCPRGLAAVPLLCAAASESRSAYLARLHVTHPSNGWWAKQEPLCLEVDNLLSIPEKLIIAFATYVERISLILSNHMDGGWPIPVMSPRVLQAFLWPVHNVFLCAWICLILVTTYLGSLVVMSRTLLFGAKRTNAPLGRLFMEEVHPSARAVESLCEQHQAIGVRVSGLALMPLMIMCDLSTSIVGRLGILMGSLVFVGMGVCSWWYWLCVLPWLAVCGLCLAVMSGWCFGLIELAGN